MKTKRFLTLLFMIIMLFIVMAAGSKANNSIFAQNNTPRQNVLADEPTGGGVDQVVAEGSKNFFLENWAVLLVAFLTFWEVVARLTPTEKDNTLLAWLQGMLNLFLPNLKKGGGRLAPPAP